MKATRHKPLIWTLRNIVLPSVALIFVLTSFSVFAGGQTKTTDDEQRKTQAETIFDDGRLLAWNGTDDSKRESIQKFEQARKLFHDLNDSKYEAICLHWLGFVHSSIGEKQKALEYYGQALPLRRQAKDKGGEAATLINIGGVYDFLGGKQKALDFYSQSLPLFRQVRDKSGEATTLAGIGLVYSGLGEKQKALSYYRRALTLHRQGRDQRGVAIALINIGQIYKDSGKKQQALELFNQSFGLCRQEGDKDDEAVALNNIGLLYDDLGETQKALKFYNQSLALLRQVGDKDFEAKSLSNLMAVWETLKAPRLAVLYGKQSVNVYQGFRSNIASLSKETQKTYLKSIEHTYRYLADILIEGGRIAEAEEVLAMLKEEEFYTYVRRDDKIATDLKGRISLSADEKKAFEDYEKFADDITNTAAEFGELDRKLRDLPLGKSLSAADQKQYDLLKQKNDAAVVVFDKFLNDLKVRFGTNDKRVAIVESDTQGILKRLDQPRTVVISTIVGEDRLNLILTTADVQRAHTVDIKAADLNKLVSAFRDAVKNPNVDPRPLGKKLFDILFPAGLLKDLDGIKADTLVWSLDGTLRYVPMAALWDGQQYLVERYTNAVLTLASRDKISVPTADRTKWLALGVGVSKQYKNFTALTAVPQELCSVIRDPNKKDFCSAFGKQQTGVIEGLMLPDDEFTLQSFEQNVGKVPVVHIASHFSLNAGDESDSYLLLGGGAERRFSLADLRKTRLDQVELLTLSACNTAMTSGDSSSGVEIEGFGALAQNQGAKTILATLWSVADNSTRDLMAGFYGGLEADRKIGKAEALQRSQIALLKGTTDAKPSPDARRSDPVNLGDDVGAQRYVKDPTKPFAHPYYWAPFVLIGNWR